MIALLRLGLFVLLIELIFYGLLMVYIRSLKREELEKKWDARHPDIAGPSDARRRFVALSMVGFNKTLRARLVGLVLVLPFIAIMVIIWLVNYR